MSVECRCCLAFPREKSEGGTEEQGPERKRGLPYRQIEAGWL